MKIDQVAAQLYTCRDKLRDAAGIARSLKRLREIGYTAVEASSLGKVSYQDFARILADTGMTCVSAHEPAKELLGSPGAVADRLRALGCKIVVYPFPDGIDFAKRNAVDAFIAKLQQAGDILARAGCALCYHNHNLEFRKLDGATILDLIFAGTSPLALQSELDTYWVQFGGGDIIQWCRKLAGRLPIIHLKDFCTTPANQPAWCELGQGVFDFKAIVATAEAAGCRWFVVEQDTCPGDPFDSLAKSFLYLQEQIVS